jgi:membrane protein YdbS with pleckstrin-like domain
VASTSLHSGILWTWRLSTWFAFLLLGIPLFFIDLTMLTTESPKFATGRVILIILTMLYFICVIVFTEIFVRLSYKNWKYEFTATNLKVESGIIWKRYSNIPYARIQNVDIQRGIFARMLEYSEVNLQTAGYSATAQGRISAEGYLPAVPVQDAEKIRDFVMAKVQGKNSGGL